LRRASADDFEAFWEANGRAGSTDRNGWPKTLTAAELLSLELPPIRWSVAGLLPEGVTLLAGKPKLGKSWMALGIAIAISTGAWRWAPGPSSKETSSTWPSKTTTEGSEHASRSSSRE
jgi:hypothetical protein